MDENQLITYLEKLSESEGYKYISDKEDVKRWLERQIDPPNPNEYTLENLWHLYYINNIFKEPINLESIKINQINLENVTSGGDKKYTKKRAPNKNATNARKQTIKNPILIGGNFNPDFNTLTVLTLTHPTTNDKFYIYGSSLPYLIGTAKDQKINQLKQLYNVYKKFGITEIISLQNCDYTRDIVHINSCKKHGYEPTVPTDPTQFKQKSIWEGKSLKRNEKYIFTNNEIKDMTAGSLYNFKKLSETNIWDSSTLIHCYAGFGRTGCALLFYLLRFIIMFTPDGYATMLQQQFLGQKSFVLLSTNQYQLTSVGMFNYLKTQFSHSIRLFDGTQVKDRSRLEPHKFLSPFKKITKHSRYKPQKMIEELFKIDNLTSANLFVTRINYILLYTALFLNLPTEHPLPGQLTTADTDIYLYPRHTSIPPGGFNNTKIFKSPIKTDIYSYIQNNPFGLIEHNKPELPKPILTPPLMFFPQVTQQPVTQQPVTQQPVTQQPVTQQPVTQQPVTQQQLPPNYFNFSPKDSDSDSDRGRGWRNRS